MPRGRSLISGTVPTKKLHEISGTFFYGNVPEISGTVPMFLHCYNMQNNGTLPEISGMFQVQFLCFYIAIICKITEHYQKILVRFPQNYRGLPEI